jgi:hypothetical protein
MSEPLDDEQGGADGQPLERVGVKAHKGAYWLGVLVGAHL